MKSRSWFVIVAVVLMSAFSFAQPGESRRGQERERIETIIIGKFANELELTPEQAERFYPRFRVFREQTELLHQDQQVRTRQLEELSHNSGTDPQRVAELLDAQEKQQRQLAEIRRQFLADIGGFLSPQQVSRTAIMLDEVPRKIRQFIQDRNHDDGSSLKRRERSGVRQQRRQY